MPEECDEEPQSCETNTSDSDSNAEEKTSWSDDDDQSAQQPSFPEFHQLMKEAIDNLGGNVFPKLNWSSPRDASWMGFGNSLKCSSPAQVWLLLKSSDFVTHDLTQPYKDTEDVLIVEDFQEPQYVLVIERFSNHQLIHLNTKLCVVSLVGLKRVDRYKLWIRVSMLREGRKTRWYNSKRSGNTDYLLVTIPFFGINFLSDTFLRVHSKR